MKSSVLLVLPSKHHALHILGLLASAGQHRFSEIVEKTGHFDAEIGRGLNYLKQAHLIRTRTVTIRRRVVLTYSISVRGMAAWESFQAYIAAAKSREAILGRPEVQSCSNILACRSTKGA